MSKQALDQRKKVEQDLKEALNEMERLPREYQLKTLMQVYDKHLMLGTAPVKVSHYDLMVIISNAKQAMVDLPGRLVVSKKELYQSDIRFVAMLESFIGCLNRLECFKRLPMIDKTPQDIEYGDDY